MSGFKVIAAPTAEPISLEEARRHLRYDVNNDSPPANPDNDPWIEDIGIPGARDYCERWMERSVAPQTIETALDAFTDVIELPGSPVAEIESVKYLDVDGVDQTLAADQYVLDNYVEPALLRPAYGTSWPPARATTNSVRIRYSTGYTLATDSPNDRPLPPSIKTGMLLVLGTMDHDREHASELKLEEIPLSAKAHLLPYRIRMSMA